MAPCQTTSLCVWGAGGGGLTLYPPGPPHEQSQREKIASVNEHVLSILYFILTGRNVLD
jgi:hypothetical protein